MRRAWAIAVAFYRRVNRELLLYAPIPWVLQVHRVVPAVLLVHVVLLPAVNAYDARGHWIWPMSQAFYVLATAALMGLVLWARAAIRRSVHAEMHRSEGLRLFVGALVCGALIGTIPGVTVVRLEAQLEAVLTVDGLCREAAIVEAMCERCDACAWGVDRTAAAFTVPAREDCPQRGLPDEFVGHTDLLVLTTSNNLRSWSLIGEEVVTTCEGMAGRAAELGLYRTRVDEALGAVFWRENHAGERLVVLLVMLLCAEFVVLYRTVAHAVLLRGLAGLGALWFTVTFIDLVYGPVAQRTTVTVFLAVHAGAVALLLVGWGHARLWRAGTMAGLVAVLMAPFVPFLWVWRLTMAHAPPTDDFAVPRGLLAVFVELTGQVGRFPHAGLKTWWMAAGLTLVTVAVFAPLAWRAGTLPAREG